MSLHKSLKLKNRLIRRRNVLSRDERVARLTDEGRREEGDSVYGLPKVKPAIVGRRRAAKPKKAETPVEGAALPAEGAGEETAEETSKEK